MFFNLCPFLDNSSPFFQNQVISEEFFQSIEQYEILVVGAGGLGCQIIKNLALSGLRKIHLIDMDTIDLTNLNRQFLFREKDIGRYKSSVVAEVIMKKYTNIKIIAHTKRIQEFSFQFYKKFGIIVAGLDNVQARKYLNNIVFALNMDKCQDQQGNQQNSQENYQQNNQQENTVKCYYIDGATQRFEGQALVVEPFKTSCYECSILDGLATQPISNFCTIANTPRTPEHCIQYVLQILWEEQHGNQKHDNDNLVHMQWVYEKSLQRAKKFKIEGVTEMLTLGVTKNIIPAIASTNALIAGVVTGEVFKLLTGCGPALNNYFLYRGAVSIGSDTYPNQQKPSCLACKMKENRLDSLQYTFLQTDTLSSLLAQIKKTHKYLTFSIINHKNKTLLNSLDSQRYEQRLKMTFGELIKQGRFNDKTQPEIVYVTDNSLKSELQVEITISTTAERVEQYNSHCLMEMIIDSKKHQNN